MTNVVQQYRLLRLETNKGALDFTRRVVLILPHDLQRASIGVQLPCGLVEPLSLEKSSYLVKWIAYRLTAWTESVEIEGKTKATYAPSNAHSLVFRHPVEHRCFLTAGRLQRGRIHLFTKMSLNRILDVQDFPGATGLQFIC